MPITKIILRCKQCHSAVYHEVETATGEGAEMKEEMAKHLDINYSHCCLQGPDALVIGRLEVVGIRTDK